MTVFRNRGALELHDDVAHTEHALSYIVSGEFELVSGFQVTISAGSFGAIPAGVPHRVLGGEGEWWTVGFCGSCLRLPETHILMQPFGTIRRGASPIATVAKGRRRPILGWLKALAEECERGEPESFELARSLLLLLLGELVRARPRTKAAPSGGVVGDALAFIQTHAMQEISLKDVAKAVHRTPAHVAFSVKEATGYTVGDWIRSIRVSEAAALLIHTDDSLDDIARRVGWNDKTHFIRQFRKQHQMTPAAWRRAMRIESS